jgi:hypothetical protein
MLRLQTFYGLQNVFGIVTNYQQWRICWLPSSSDSAASVAMPTSQQNSLNSAADLLAQMDLDQEPSDVSIDAAPDK